MLAIVSAHVTRTRHDLSRTHFLYWSRRIISFSGRPTSPQIAAVP